MADERVTALEQEVNKLKQTIEQLTARIEVLEGGDDDHHEEEKKPRKSASKKKKGGSSKKGASKKKDKKASASKKNAKKAADDKKVRLKNQKTNSYHVVGKKMFVEVPEPFKFGTKHKVGPALRLDLNYAYGYNGNIPGNLLSANDTEIAYALAGAVVCLDPADPTKQRFFTGHNEDVVSIAKSPVADIIASGQRDPKGEGTPFICIFDSAFNDDTIMQEKGRLVNVFARSVCSVGFTHDGKYVFGVGEDDARTGSLFDVTKITSNEGKSITLSKPTETNLGVSKDEVWGQAHAPALIDDCYAWATWGKKNVSWWTFNPSGEKGSRVVKKTLSSMQETKKTQKAYNCACWTSDCNLLVGCPDGCIYMFHQNALKLTHWWDTGKAGIVSIYILNAEEGIYRATDDKGNIYEYNWKESGGKHAHKLEREVAFKAGGKVTVAIDHGGSSYYGTKGSTLNATDYSVEEPESKLLMTGFTKEIWALAAHPTQPWLVVGCDDKRLKLWDYEQKNVLWSTKNHGGVRTADFSRDGNLLVVGATTGAVQVYEVADPSNIADPVFDKKICKEEVSAVAFSADGSMVIVGSWDQTVRLIKCNKGKWKLSKTMKGHTSSVTHICLSEDGNYAQSCSKDVETLFWDVNAGKRVDYCDVNTIWDRWNCIFGWPVQGLFHAAGDPTDVNCCEISGGNAIDDEGGKKCVASGDDTGHVTIFKYPILEEKPKHVDEYLVHSAHVTNVRWSEDDAWLFSVGGGDLACFQWAVSEK